MPFAMRRGARLHYRVAGSDDAGAPVLVLIRGFARSGRFWGGFLGELGDRYRLVVPDNRGVGGSDVTTPPYSTAMLADDIAAVLDDAGVDRGHVFGLSLGGMIAQQLALRHPRRVDRMVLGCTHAGGRGTRPPRATLLATLRAGAMAPEEAMRSMAPHLLSPETLAARPEVLDAWAAASRAETRSRLGILGQLTAALRHDTRRRLAEIAAPTLVITGDADRMIAPRHSRAIAERIPGARLVVLPGAGHDLSTDRPAEVAREIVTFLG